jgi:hypothetical protein
MRRLLRFCSVRCRVRAGAVRRALWLERQRTEDEGGGHKEGRISSRSSLSLVCSPLSLCGPSIAPTVSRYAVL